MQPPPLPKLRRRVRRKSLRDYPLIGEGQVGITFLSPDGKPMDYWDLGKNLIVLQGSANMSHLLAGDDVANRIVTTIAVGSAGHDPLNPTQALPVSTADTALFSSPVISLSTTYSFPNGSEGGQVMFSATIEANQANGTGTQAISEYGLFDINNRMLTHKSSGLISKDSDFGILLQWTISYV